MIKDKKQKFKCSLTSVRRSKSPQSEKVKLNFDQVNQHEIDSLEIIDEIHLGYNPILIPQPAFPLDSPIRLTLTEARLLAGKWLTDHEIF